MSYGEFKDAVETAASLLVQRFPEVEKESKGRSVDDQGLGLLGFCDKFEIKSRGVIL